jgi:hypothetical protein
LPERSRTTFPPLSARSFKRLSHPDEGHPARKPIRLTVLLFAVLLTGAGSGLIGGVVGLVCWVVLLLVVGHRMGRELVAPRDPPLPCP